MAYGTCHLSCERYAFYSQFLLLVTRVLFGFARFGTSVEYVLKWQGLQAEVPSCSARIVTWELRTMGADSLI